MSQEFTVVTIASARGLGLVQAEVTLVKLE